MIPASAFRAPFAPLEAYVGRRFVDRFGTPADGPDIAITLGIVLRQVYRWRTTGLTIARADELAIRAGAHPAEIWPDYWQWPYLDLDIMEQTA